MATITAGAEGRTDGSVAIRVENVSKSYGLWSSPSARLNYPLLNMLRRVAPSPLARRIEGKTGHMYREFHALQDVSLEIKKGESWGIIGVNGSGKSTLLKMIAGNLRPSSGWVEVEGRVAILDYSSGLHGGFTGRENVYLKAAMHGMSRREIDAKFESIARFADIGEFIDQPVKTYSSGMVARLGFAILAHVDADIIITDEALAVGDAFFVQKCMDFIRSFLERGTFLFVSHSTGDVVSLCEQAIWLDHGKIRKRGSAKEVAQAYLAQHVTSLSQAYLEKEAIRDGFAAGSIDRPPAEYDAVRLEQPAISRARDARSTRVIRDPRLDLINLTQWRNDIEIPQFHNVASSYGVGGAEIEEVLFEDQDGAVFSTIIGGEMVHVKMTVRADRDLTSPIVGFQVQDRLGQTLFGDNTYVVTVQRPFLVKAGERFQARFCFQMPLLPVGEYAIRAAVARGTETDAAMMHIIDTALVFRSITSGARYGMIGIPMQFIELTKVRDLVRRSQDGCVPVEQHAKSE